MLHSDYSDLLSCFAAADVAYLLVGAYALAVHGYPRSTGDMDVWVDRSGDNPLRVHRALMAFGAPMAGVEPAIFSDEDLVFQIGVAPCRIDILTGISGGIPFADALAMAEHLVIDGFTIPVLCREHLIVNKLATGRPRDLDDVRVLRGERNESR